MIMMFSQEIFVAILWAMISAPAATEVITWWDFTHDTLLMEVCDLFSLYIKIMVIDKISDNSNFADDGWNNGLHLYVC